MLFLYEGLEIKNLFLGEWLVYFLVFVLIVLSFVNIFLLLFKILL